MGLDPSLLPCFGRSERLGVRVVQHPHLVALVHVYRAAGAFGGAVEVTVVSTEAGELEPVGQKPKGVWPSIIIFAV